LGCDKVAVSPTNMSAEYEISWWRMCFNCGSRREIDRLIRGSKLEEEERTKEKVELVPNCNICMEMLAEKMEVGEEVKWQKILMEYAGDDGN
jgi:hypothetical protein